MLGPLPSCSWHVIHHYCCQTPHPITVWSVNSFPDSASINNSILFHKKLNLENNRNWKPVSFFPFAMDSATPPPSVHTHGPSEHLALALRSTNWQVSPKLEQNVYLHTDRIFIDLNWSQNRFSPNPVEIHIQQTLLPSTEKVGESVESAGDYAPFSL